MANYTGNAVFTTELVIKKKAALVWGTAHPFWGAMSSNPLNMNKGFDIKDSKMLLPINYAAPTTRADGKATANMFTPVTPFATNGFDHAVYEFSRIEGYFNVRADENKLLKDPKRMNFLPNKAAQMMEDFKYTISTDLASATVESIEKPMGIRYLLSTSNTVGGIDQGANAWWRARVDTSLGAFSTKPFDDAYDLIGTRGMGAADMMLLSIASGANVYGAFRDLAAPLQRFNSPNRLAKLNFPKFEYLEMMCFPDNHLGSAATGTAAMLSTETLYVGGDTSPQAQHEGSMGDRIIGTGSTEFFYEWWLVWGCDDPNRNWYGTGIEV